MRVDGNAKQSKCSKMSERKAVIKCSGMSEEMQQDALDYATRAVEKFKLWKVSM